MDPCIESLPFVIQRRIMDFRPKLYKIENFHIVLEHLANRYCEKCGEYIDLQYKLNKKYPVHSHYRERRFIPKKYKYLSIYPSIHLHFNYELRKIHSLYIYSYRNLSTIDTIYSKVLFLKKQVEYLFNFKKLINGRQRRCIPIYNIYNINIFKNPDFIFTHKPLGSQSNRYILTDELLHPQSFLDFLISLKTWYVPEIEYYYFDFILNSPHILNYFITHYPKRMIEVFSFYQLLHSHLFFEKINSFPFLLDHIDEKIVKKMFKKNKSWFLDRKDILKEHIEFFCPLEETSYLRENY